MIAAAKEQALVAIIDDDDSVREALRGLFRSVGLQVELFASTEEYRERPGSSRPNCLVLDVRLPGKSGLEFQSDLNQQHDCPPIIFISGHADVAMSVRAMKSGAVEFLTKPVRDQDLLDAVQLAIASDRERRRNEERLRQVDADFRTLTSREREVLKLVVAGHRNKAIAAILGLSEATIKLYRGHLMQKLKVQTLVELVRTADLHSLTSRRSTKG